MTEKILTFFYLLFLDEHLAFELSIQAERAIQKKVPKNKKPNPAEIVLVLNRLARSARRHPVHLHITQSPGKWNIPSGLNLTSWREFLRDSDWDLAIPTILQQVLDFKVEDVAVGLGVSSGTVVYRVGKSLENLGGFVD